MNYEVQLYDNNKEGGNWAGWISNSISINCLREDIVRSIDISLNGSRINVIKGKTRMKIKRKYTLLTEEV